MKKNKGRNSKTRDKRSGRSDRSGKSARSGRYRSMRSGPYILKKKKCRFCIDKNLKINYLDYQLLRRFTTERGKIIPSRISGSCAKHQRKLAKAIKRARNISLVPFLAE